MKKALIMLTLFLPFMALAQSPNFSIAGHIGKLDAPAMAYLDYMDNGVSHEDSCIVENGAFKFSGEVSGISYARMALSHHGMGKPNAIYSGGDVIYFYFSKDNLVMVSNDSLSNASVKGSKIYDESLAYNNLIGGTIMDLTKTVNTEFNKLTPEQQKDTLLVKQVDNRYRENIAKRTERQFEFAKNHPNSFFGLVALSESAGSMVDAAKVSPVFETLSDDLKKTDMGKELLQRIQSVSLTTIGKEAPVFIENNTVNKAISLTQLKGKVVLVEFWASWCTPCRAENPNLVKQYKLYQGKGFEIIAVSLDSKRENWLNAIEQDGLPWLHVSDLKGWNSAVGRLYGVRAVPANFLVDATGKIIASNLRGEQLNAKLAELF